jgi:hypothetical protein
MTMLTNGRIYTLNAMVGGGIVYRRPGVDLAASLVPASC